MENFRKVRSEEATAGFGTKGGGPGPFADLAPGAVHMRVKEGSKIRNLLSFATASMAQPDTRAIIFSGCGRATTKTVTCAEILKRRLAGLHQVTRLRYQSVREVWQSLPHPGTTPGPTPGQKHSVPGASLSVLKNVPSLAILLSKDALDPRQPGYQSPSPSSDPSYLPMAATSKRSLREPAVAEGSLKGTQPEPRAAEEDLTA
ncbi:ribonuclease P and MRP subunit p25 [Phyllostomus discolor]|uniref:Ribonuclease P and MRP subunit p25 n=1 Tax=Phyllostomus discolor TaxID=89673 RepID=A0A6J2LCE7_9CHIR|nr:ribonuclease P protein subunit p25 [Phyllostomus discolor]KAF6132648.1 ribonuclease P and MRP subunit p25 [Phyllostomus discolor]